MSTRKLLIYGAAAAGGLLVYRGVNVYRTAHYTADPYGRALPLSFLQGLKGFLHLGTYPAIQSATAGASISLVPSLAPSVRSS